MSELQSSVNLGWSCHATLYRDARQAIYRRPETRRRRSGVVAAGDRDVWIGQDDLGLGEDWRENFIPESTL